jgi:hypothetical protein
MRRNRQMSRYASNTHAWAAAVLAFLMCASVEAAPPQARDEVKIPDPPGWLLMKCDFHMHTIFSDGLVWPTVRVDEAWQTGLDAIAITDHIEYRPHKDDVSPNLNRSFELAEPWGRTLGVLVVKSAEITRNLPPGHFNALFVTDVNKLDTKEWRDAIRAAIDQGAFVYWDHPNYQHPQNKCEWFKEHTEIYDKGWMHGIEVVNGREYYPEAHRWCIDRKLTMMCGSDIHQPMAMGTEGAPGERRPMTIVLVKSKTPDAMKEALVARRTLVYAMNMLIGETQYLKPIFDASVAPVSPGLVLRGKERAYLQLRNTSEISYELEAAGEPAEVSTPRKLTLQGNRVSLFEVRAKSAVQTGTKKAVVPYVVKNLLAEPGKGLPVTLEFEVTFIK